jgi:hypothetical protein
MRGRDEDELDPCFSAEGGLELALPVLGATALKAWTTAWMLGCSLSPVPARLAFPLHQAKHWASLCATSSMTSLVSSLYSSSIQARKSCTLSLGVAEAVAWKKATLSFKFSRHCSLCRSFRWVRMSTLRVALSRMQREGWPTMLAEGGCDEEAAGSGWGGIGPKIACEATRAQCMQLAPARLPDCMCPWPTRGP